MKTLFDKIWDAHVVKSINEGPNVLYIDRQFIHEVTSPVAFVGMDNRGIKVARPEQTTATPDHNVPTINQDQRIEDDESRSQIEKLEENCKKHNIFIHSLGKETHGIVHIVGPELGLTQPGMTIVCGDSHTSTHGAFGAIAFGIGTSEVEMCFASQCIMQPKPKKMKITINGSLNKGVNAKDLVLYVISKQSTSGGTGYFVEFTGQAIEELSMEERMTVCNMSIEMGARGGLIAPDQKTFDYLKDRPSAPKGAEWDTAVEKWNKLKSDDGAEFDAEFTYHTDDIKPMITYGTNPGMGLNIFESIPVSDNMDDESKVSFQKSLKYMGFNEGDAILGKPVDYVFLGSCTNGRIEDFRAFAEVVKGRQKADNVVAWLVPGSKLVEKQIIEEKIDRVLVESGFELRQPGCSACLAMNDDKVPAGLYAVSTTNRNFEGRQGPGSRTLLAGPYIAAAAAITGKVTDPNEYL